METYSREFALFIDGVRLERGLTRDDLIENIISLSQYKRYLRGVAPIPNNVVVSLADRLKYNVADFYSLYSRKHNKELKSIKDIYSLLQEHKYQSAYDQLMDIKNELIVSSFNKLFYDYCVIFSQYKLNRISEVHVLSIFSELIDYPACMDNESYNMIELNILNQIVVISSKMENFEPAKNLYHVLSKGELNFSNNDDYSVLPVVYYNVSRVFYQQKDYEKMLDLTTQGINMANKHKNSNALPHLYLLNSIANKELGNYESSLKSIKKCFIQIMLWDSKIIFESFVTSYNKHFDTPIEDLLKDISDLI